MRGAIAQPRMHASDAMVRAGTCGGWRLPASCKSDSDIVHDVSRPARAFLAALQT